MSVLRLWPSGSQRIAVLTFTVDGMPYKELATTLSQDYGIGVRHGCFCAHPLMTTLLKIEPDHEAALRESLAQGNPVDLPGAVRASIGLGTTQEDCHRLVTAVAEIVARQPAAARR